MPNNYFNNTTSFTPGTLASGTEVDDKFDAVESGFDTIEADSDNAIKLTNADITTSQEIADDALTRANKVIGFDPDGTLTLKNPGLTWRSDWVTSTFYRVNDVVEDAVGAIGLGNIYICTVEHTSSDLAAEVANWDLMVDVEAVTAAKTAAETAQGLAETAATNAATSLSNFEDQYLGSFATNPVGTTAGQLYWNTTVSLMYVYTGTAWDVVGEQLTAGNSADITGGNTTEKKWAGSEILGAFTQVLSNPGYTKFPNGLIIQFGSIETSSSTDITVTFPTTFPVSCLSIVSTHVSVDPTNTSKHYSAIAGRTTSSFRLGLYDYTGVRRAGVCRYIAIGY